MKADDNNNKLEAMWEKMDKIFDNDIYEVCNIYTLYMYVHRKERTLFLRMIQINISRRART